MKAILFILAFVFLSNLTFSQSQIGYKYNYEIRFDVSQFVDKEPKNTVRKFVDYLFEAKNQKFNVQTRYNVNGVIYISSDNIIDRYIVEDFFRSEQSSVLSFEKIPQHTKSKETKNTFAQN